MKHFPFDAGEREDRDVNDRDNDDTEKHRVRDLFTCREHNLKAFLARKSASEFVLSDSQLAHHVFNDHDRAVDDESEINRAETHQVT